jgi:hypothetical protein
MKDKEEWENVISNIAQINSILPDAIVVGGTAFALYSEHRTSDLKDRQNKKGGPKR